MSATATVRELRNSFPKVKKLVEEEGEVVVTERGTPKYRLMRYRQDRRRNAPPAKDYMARLRSHQPSPLSDAVAAALHDLNRGDR
jgi:antitoxin (DNA-binding transcriptional repressor) of toxin-antitoxin stability system